jgi:hypothetical protein
MGDPVEGKCTIVSRVTNFKQKYISTPAEQDIYSTVIQTSVLYPLQSNEPTT